MKHFLWCLCDIKQFTNTSGKGKRRKSQSDKKARGEYEKYKNKNV